VYGEPHNEEGVVYINDEHTKQAQFVRDRILSAEKEM
jgi:SSS family solute:Na+ symporter